MVVGDDEFAQMMANRPPIVTTTVVTKITTKSLGADEFAVPAGYTRQEIPTRMPQPAAPPAGGGGSGGAPSTHSLPE